MKRLRVGIVGLRRGLLFVDMFRRMPECEVVAVCDTDPKVAASLKDLKAHTEYDRFLEEGLDIVAVISPGPAHATQSLKAMAAGAHVLCETPCVYSLEEARSVAAESKRSGRKFMLAEDHIWMGCAVRMQEKAREGVLGEIVYAEGDYTHDCRDLMLIGENGYIPYAERHKHPEAVRSWRATHLPPLLYTSHTLGPLLHVMDDRVVAAFGFGAGSRTAPDLGTTDLEAGLFLTKKGSIVRLTNGFTVAHPYTLYYNLVGTRGSIKVMRGAGAELCLLYSDAAVPKTGKWQPAPSEWFNRPDGKNHVAVMVQNFVDSVSRDTPPPLDVFRSLDFILPGITAHESALRGGVKLEVPDLR